MRDVPPELGTCTTLCWAWVVRLKDGSCLGFTDHDASLEFLGVTCDPGSGFRKGASESVLGLAADTDRVEAVLGGVQIAEADLRSGRFDGARVDSYRVDWKAQDKFVHFSTGIIGEAQQKGGAFQADILGDAARLENATGRVFSRMCDAELGDARCGVDIALFPAGTQCPRSFAACHGVFNNAINFRGFPYLLGDDALTASPLEGERRDGRSRFRA